MSHHKKEYRLRGHDSVYRYDRLQFEDSLILGDDADVYKPTAPNDTVALGDSMHLDVEVPMADAVALGDAATVTDGAPESRVGYARVGYSEVGA